MWYVSAEHREESLVHGTVSVVNKALDVVIGEDYPSLIFSSRKLAEEVASIFSVDYFTEVRPVTKPTFDEIRKT